MKVTLSVRAPKKPEKRVVVEHDVVIGRGKDCNLQSWLRMTLRPKIQQLKRWEFPTSNQGN